MLMSVCMPGPDSREKAGVLAVKLSHANNLMSADSNGDGTLAIEQFRESLSDTNLGLSEELIDYLADSASTDGVVSYEEVASRCYKLLNATIAKGVKSSATFLMEACPTTVTSSLG